ncbi:ParB/RepB/Spo0J family partition protein [Streptococcus sp.]|uniref:ParB/RepB/Spo0J family partition protein n=1 Tax=Streptococcus sp. TaxID=1306 RepID=UPI00359FF74F
MEELKYIEIGEITPNPYQPRIHFEEEKLEELAQSIRANGLIQPLIVRKSAIIGYELLAGERRLRASQLAGLTKVPVIIKELSDEDMLYQSIIENLQRADLNPIEEATSYKKLLDKGLTHEEMARIMGKSRPYISNSLRLLNLSDKLQQSVASNQLSQGHARLLVPLSAEDQESWLQQILEGDMSVRSLEEALTLKKTRKKEKKNTFIQVEEENLRRMLGVDVQIRQKKDSSGHIKLSFADTEEYHRLINNLKKACE